jgi:hypothetical protein
MNRLIRFTFLVSCITLMIPGIASASTSGAAGTCSAFAAGSCPTSIPSGVNSFYFIDYAGGSDNNSGASETAPFQHIPCGANAAGNAAAACTSTPGTGWIFKGGVTVDFHSWPANVPFGGTSAAPTYIGPDPGWFTGGSWSRPIFNGGGSTGYDSSAAGLIGDRAHTTNWVVIDNIEFTGLYWSSSSGNGNSNYYAYCYVCNNAYAGDANWEVKNIYAHNWTNIGAGAYDPAGYQALISLPADGTPGKQSSLHDSVVDGSDSQQNCCMASGAAIQYNNYYSYLVDNPYNDGLTTNGLVILHDNYSTLSVNSSGGVHENCFHLFASNGTGIGGTAIIYNNFDDCRNVGTNAEPMAFELIGATVYAFNNVIAAGNPAGISNSSWSSTSAGTTIFEFNNTIQAYDARSVAASSCYTSGYKNVAMFADNFCITNNNNGPSVGTFGPFTGNNSFPSPTFTLTCSGGAQSNLGMSQICAPVGTGNGTGNLNFTETYPFAPMDATAAATVGTGQSNASYCAAVSAINATAGNACLSDTTLGVSYISATHTVSWPSRSPVARPSSGAWTNGAYQYANGQAPTPPTGLAAAVQ